MTRPRALHRGLVSAVSAFNRNPWTSERLELLPRDEHPFYAEDGLWTHHGHAFTEEPRFVHAYERAIIAGGFDYGIRWRVHTILWAAENAARLDGAFVECGTARGFVASAICAFPDWSTRPFYLFDTFQPGACRYYAESPEAVAPTFNEWPGVRLVVGEIPASFESLEAQTVGEVAFLHVDLNHAPSEEAAVRHFWPKLDTGGTMVFDDYGFQGFEASREAADALGRELGYTVLTLPTGQGLVVK